MTVPKICLNLRSPSALIYRSLYLEEKVRGLKYELRRKETSLLSLWRWDSEERRVD